MPEPLRALVIGCGTIAGGYNEGSGDAMVLTHALAYVRHPDYMLAACADPNPTARAAFVRRWAPCSEYANLDAALDAETFDIASICTPTGSHLAVLARLLGSDVRAVFAEKPLDGDAAGARAIGAMFTAKRVPVAVNFTRRFDPAMHELRAELGSGRHGALRAVAGWYCRGILNNGSHLIDLIAFLTGSVPRLETIIAVHEDGIPNDPSVSALLNLDGVPVHLIAGDARDFNRFEVEFVFSAGIIALEESGLSVRRRRVGPSRRLPATKLADLGSWQPSRYGEAMLRALDELKTGREGSRISSDITSAADAIEVAEGIRRRAMEGHGFRPKPRGAQA